MNDATNPADQPPISELVDSQPLPLLKCKHCANTSDRLSFRTVEDVTAYRNLDLSSGTPVAGPVDYTDGDDMRLLCTACWKEMPAPSWLLDIDWDWG